MFRRIALLAVFALAFARPVFAAPTAGSLVRIVSNSAVYYVADDGKRHVFPDTGTYASWFADFSRVQTISDSDMAALPLGRNVTRKPGVRMVKIQSDPKVYAVDRGGALRWVKDEGTARVLYGTAWNRTVDDVSDAFFVDYYPSTDVASSADFDPKAASVTTIDEDLRTRTGASIQSAPGKLFVTAAVPMTPRSTVLGAIKAVLSGFQLTAPQNAGVDVTGMRLQGYVDQGENDADFQPGGDTDGTSLTTVTDLMPRVGLYDDIGNLLAGPVSVASDGTVAFTSFHLTLGAGTQRTVFIRGDISRNVELGGGADRLSFDIVNASTDLTFAADGAAVQASGSLPNGGLKPLYPTTVRRTGKMTFDWVGTSGYGIASKDAMLGAFTATAANDDFEIRTLTLQVPGPLTSVKSLRLEQVGGLTYTMPYVATATFENLGIRIKQGSAANFRLIAELNTPAQGALRTDIIRASFGATAPLLFVSSSSGDTFREGSLGTDSASFTSRASEVQVRFTQLSARKLPDSPSGTVPRSENAEVLRFGLRADAADPVRVRKLTFRVTPSDVNTTGSNNDLLERWATAVGSNEAGGIVTMRWSGDEYADALGEAGNAIDIRSAIADRNDARNASPSGHVTVYGDTGVITYTFPESYEPIVLAGQEALFRLYLNTTWFYPGQKSLTVQMLGAHDLEWVDGLQGSPASTIDGTTVSGVPSSPSVLTVP